MHVYYKFGLFLIFILSASTHYTRASPAPGNQSLLNDDNDFTDDYDEYYDDSDTNSTTHIKNDTVVSLPTLFVASDAVNATHVAEPPALPPRRSNHVLEPSCPRACLCLEDYKLIRCNNAALTRIPRGFPSSALIIDLSHNHITELADDDFANVSKVREINFNNNHLKVINKEAFGGLNRLQRLNLANNKLTNIEVDAFAGARDLSELDLSNNTIVLPSKGPFIIQPGLTKFSCRNCSWNQLYDDTFANLTSLTSLKLDQNDFQRQINKKAFAPLPNLIRLQLPELDQDSVEELCNQLKAIDNISFKHFDISCFELVLGATFNESIILATLPTKKPTPAIEFVPAPTDTVEVPTDKAGGANKPKPKTESGKVDKMAAGNEFLNLTLPTTITSIINEDIDTKNSTILTASVLGGNGTDNSTKITKAAAPIDDKEKVYQVPVSQETINLILICIIIIAVVGIIIGIIFRKDVGGIKTKCCRTRKPEPKDQVHPTEEIPLNKLA